MKTDKDILVVDLDWSSTGIWLRGSDGHSGNTNYDWLNLPPWLIARFEYWTWWYNRWAPFEREGAEEREPDEELFDAYGLSLAVDLKRVVGDRFVVMYMTKREIQIPHPETVEQVYDHLSSDTQPKDSAWMKEFPIPQKQE